MLLCVNSSSVSHHMTMQVITFKMSCLPTIQLDHTHKRLQLSERTREKWSKPQRSFRHESKKVERFYENKILTFIMNMNNVGTTVRVTA